MIVESIDEYQPRFRAWLRSLNVKSGDDVKLYEYIAWINRKCSEFQAANGISFLTEDNHRRFTDWLLEDSATLNK